ncbi:hypothetical protein [Rhizobium rhizogenes]|uniref:hypothetical protein n=1 Tax=Rhizobium rhizogenes TaxID=359 RepID=UPI002271AE62|nr:hypothetical protein [Rhizobium rhizogenes]
MFQFAGPLCKVPASSEIGEPRLFSSAMGSPGCRTEEMRRSHLPTQAATGRIPSISIGDAGLATKSHAGFRSRTGLAGSDGPKSTATPLLPRELALEDIASIGLASYNFYKHQYSRGAFPFSQQKERLTSRQPNRMMDDISVSTNNIDAACENAKSRQKIDAPAFGRWR